jgi:hypothetical protein
MDRRILEMFMVFTGLMTCVGCFTGIIITAIKRHSRQPLPNGEITGRLDDIVDRLARLENSFDSTAVEVERISEAQRFTARVLAERSGAPSMAERPRGSTTPH